MTDPSRQDPTYPADDSMRDAIAVLTAFVQPELDDELVDVALENALDGTDHTHLAYNLGMIGRMLAYAAADCRGVTAAEFVRQIGEAVASSIEDNPPDDELR